MRTTTEPLEGDLVRLSVELDEAEVDGRVEELLGRLARRVRVPGFRPGRVPRPVLEARLGGRAALREQAVGDALDELVGRALTEADIEPLTAPRVEVHAGDEGSARIEVIVEVRPRVVVPGYAGLVVTVPSVEVGPEEVRERLDMMREQFATLVPSASPARPGDVLTLDVHGTRPGGEPIDATDVLYELEGEGQDPPLPSKELDERLAGARPGDVISVPLGGAGLALEARVLVRDVRRKVLPEANDEWAREASEFDTLVELEADIRRRLGELKVARARALLPERALEALAGLVAEDPPERIVEAELSARLEDLNAALDQRGTSLEQYASARGERPEALVAELRRRVVEDVRVDLALRALASAEGIEASDDDVRAELAQSAERAGVSVDELVERLGRAGRLPAVRSDVRKRKALRWLLEHVTVVDEEGRPVDRSLLEPPEQVSPSGAGDDAGHEEAPQEGRRGVEVGAKEAVGGR